MIFFEMFFWIHAVTYTIGHCAGVKLCRIKYFVGIAYFTYFTYFTYLLGITYYVSPVSSHFILIRQSWTSVLCVCAIFFYDDEDMGTHITLKSTGRSCPEFSFPLGDKPVIQLALFQTLVGHSVIVVLYCTVL